MLRFQQAPSACWSWSRLCLVTSSRTPTSWRAWSAPAVRVRDAAAGAVRRSELKSEWLLPSSAARSRAWCRQRWAPRAGVPALRGDPHGHRSRALGGRQSSCARLAPTARALPSTRRARGRAAGHRHAPAAQPAPALRRWRVARAGGCAGGGGGRVEGASAHASHRTACAWPALRPRRCHAAMAARRRWWSLW